MGILGIRLGFEPQTDEEYVASVRAWTRYPRRSAAANACAAVLLFAGYIFWVWLSGELAARIATREGLYWPSFAVSMIFGTWSGFFLALGVYGVALGRRRPRSGDCRTECLMLRFHDEWNARNAGDEASVPPGSEPSGTGGRRIFGMGLRPERRTDPQYVEFVRKWAGQFKWFRLFYAALSILCLVGSVGLIVFWVYLVGTVNSTPDRPPPLIPIGAIALGILAGVAWGIIAGWTLRLFCEPLSRLARALAGCRAERLMLKYYDELHRQEDNRAAPAPGP